ncbi:MAG: 16S rRNA (uracil(1498)-N(3))-methyltransferase [Verrucomicrobiaceae bacterium]|nr:16S rRNA (uracil(1498)-N(3))-methyltransferase [Verrucomicrobiaceae bacterium]
MIHAHFHLPASEWHGSDVELRGEEAKHCIQVTRHRAGDVVVLFDGAGRKAEARIEAASGGVVRLHLLDDSQIPKPRCEITLLQALVKGDTMEWIIEKAVELGVQRIIPVISQRSIVRLNTAEAAKKLAKWQRVALEACKQCGQAWLPEVVMPCSVEAACGPLEADVKLTASLQPEARSLRAIRQGAARSAALAIGPEGDFTEGEYAVLAAGGFQPWSLGSLILRSETAAVCALSILGYEWASEPI